MRSRNQPAIVAVLGVVFISFAASAVHGAIIPRLERGETLKIAAIGTSLTVDVPSDPRWFAQMGDWLSTNYPGQVALSNRAVGGTASANFPEYGRAQGGPFQLNQALTYDNPDVLFIEFAINDAAKLFNLSPEQSQANLRSLISTAKTWAAGSGKNLDIIVQTMNNTGPACDLSYNDVGPYYQAWREEAAASGVLLIDHYPNWVNLYASEADHATWKHYVPDDLHPNGLGTAMVILPEIERVLMAQNVPEPSTATLGILGLTSLALFGLGQKTIRNKPSSEIIA